jgi:hypothetical protein
MLDALPIILSKARMRLTKIRAGLMALWRNNKEPIRACKLRLEMDFLDEYLVQSFKTSVSFAGGIWIIPDWMFIPIPKQVGLEEGGIDLEELN